MAEDRETAARIAAVIADAAKRGLKVSGSVLDIIADIRAQGAAAQQPEPSPPSPKPAAKPRVHRYRYAGDSKLIARGRRMIGRGMTKLAVAKQLADKATGGDYDQRVARLRKLL
jgi:hypothetical protein